MTARAVTDSPWLRCQAPRPQAAARLVCFPHAGGSAPFFRAWQGIADSVEVHAVAYPGRTERFAESPIDDAVQMATGIAEALRPLRDKPLALFGHSMGAYLAYETAHRLGEPDHLFVSGANAPHAPDHRPRLLDDDDEVLVANLARLGGADTGLLDDPELRELFLPTIRADLRLVEGYAPAHRTTLGCPVTALLGTGDDRTDKAGARRWGELTSAAFRLREYPGGHFYLEQHRQRLLEELAATLTAL